MWKITLYRLLLTLAAVSIGVLSLLPETPDMPVTFPGLDKVTHAMAYAVLAFFALKSFPGGGRKTVFCVIVACSLYGGLLEVLQQCTGRSMEGADFLCDLGGSVVGALAGAWTVRRRSEV